MAAAPSLSLADQAQIDAVCAYQPADQGERFLDQSDPLDAEITRQFAAVCGASLRELTAIFFGSGSRTYRCDFHVPQNKVLVSDFDERRRAIAALFGERSLQRPDGRWLGEWNLMAWEGRSALIVIDENNLIRTILTDEELTTEQPEIANVWGAADLIALTGGNFLSAQRPNLCEGRVETDATGWTIRDVVTKGNCGAGWRRDYRIGRSSEIEILSQQAQRWLGACHD